MSETKNSELIGINNLEYYMSQPILDTKTERDLLEKFIQFNDLYSAQKLAVANMRFVIQLSKKYVNYGFPLNDLIQEGAVGLMKAIKNFDLDSSVKLITYAVHWINAEIHEYILRNWKMVKIATTKEQRKLFFNLSKYKKHLNKLSKPEIKAIAKDLNVPIKDVVEMEQRLANHEVHLDSDNSLEQLPAANDYDYNSLKIIEKINNSINLLEDRQKNIIKQRWLTQNEPSSLLELSKEMNISIERVRQLEIKAINKLREILSA